MKKMLTLTVALLAATPALSQDNSVSIASGEINAGRMISISVHSVTGPNGAMAATARIGGSYSFEQIGNAPAVVTVSPFAPVVTFAKNGAATGGVSVTQTLPDQTFNVQRGAPQVAAPAFQATAFQAPVFQMPSFQMPSLQAPTFQNTSFFSAPQGFFGN
jgi:hypothetical protein